MTAGGAGAGGAGAGGAGAGGAGSGSAVAEGKLEIEVPPSDGEATGAADQQLQLLDHAQNALQW